MAPSKLEVTDLSMRFGGISAIRNLTFRVKEGEIFALIGPNGAGKSTVFNCISGIYKPTRGQIFFEREGITNLKPHRIARKGIARTFQNIALFRNMTVLDNLLLGRNPALRAGVIRGGFFWGTALREELAARLAVEKLIDFLEIESVRKKPVGTLPFGMQRRVELGRALALEPELLILDEPLAGLNLEEVEDMARFILDVNEEARWKVTCLLVEHDMGVVMDLSDHVFVLNFGNMIVDGTPEEVQNNPEVIKAYLGEEDLYATRR